MDVPLLLISVRSLDEACAAMEGGADWIDLKEPDRGPLGAVDASVALNVVQCIAGRAPISAAAGELVDWPLGGARELLSVRGMAYLKLGLSNCRNLDWRSRLRSVQREIAATEMQLVAVIYADAEPAASPRLEEIVEFALEAGCSWILIDTFDKSGGVLGDYLLPAKLQAVLQSLRAAGRRTGVAGSLDREAIAALPLELVDMAAVRGAACRGGRRGAICSQRVAELKTLLAASCNA